MRVLVTGATGFIGSHLCRALLAAGYPTRVLIRATSSTALIQDLDVELALGDLLDQASLEAAMQGIEIVIHCGAEVGGWHDRETMVASHVIGTENILRAVTRSRVRRLLYTSSVAALGVPDRPQDHQSPTLMDERHDWNYDPDLWPYGYAKHCAEQAVLSACAAGLDGLILNPAAVIGPGDKNLVASAIVYHMGRGRRPPIPPGGLNVVHVDDVVAGYLAAITLGRTGERYILGGENVRFEDLLQTIARVVGTRPLRLRLPGWVLHSLAGFVDALQPILHLPVRGHLFRMVGRHFYYDITKMRTELNVAPARTTLEAIQAAHRWYSDHAAQIRP
ncbi:MAG: NAD-dependent epimerase/dehydratase family protein [Anaerolineales bacterium]|nr:MAG: NAD-dependent epimerase/dehydratase family protein [Anaerolineales bacterium]